MPRNPRRRREDDWDGELPSTSAQPSVKLPADESTQLEPALAAALPRARTIRRRRDDNWDDELPSTPNQAPATLPGEEITQLGSGLVTARPSTRAIRRRRDDDWDDQIPSPSDQALATLPTEESTQLESGLVTARPSTRTTRRRKEDTWDATVSAQRGNPSPSKSSDESVERAPKDYARPFIFSRVMTWNEILDARGTPPADGTTTHEEQPHLPRSQEAYMGPPSRSSPALPELVRPPTSLEGSLSAGSFAPEPALKPGSEEPPSALAQPESFGVVSTTWKWGIP